jgi:hypothetical protein
MQRLNHSFPNASLNTYFDIFESFPWFVRCSSATDPAHLFTAIEICQLLRSWRVLAAAGEQRSAGPRVAREPIDFPFRLLLSLVAAGCCTGIVIYTWKYLYRQHVCQVTPDLGQASSAATTIPLWSLGSALCTIGWCKLWCGWTTPVSLKWSAAVHQGLRRHGWHASAEMWFWCAAG